MKGIHNKDYSVVNIKESQNYFLIVAVLFCKNHLAMLHRQVGHERGADNVSAGRQLSRYVASMREVVKAYKKLRNCSEKTDCSAPRVPLIALSEYRYFTLCDFS